MSRFGPFVAVLCLTAALRGAQPAPPDAAASVIAASREALGGEKKLAAVKSLVATGRTRQVRGDSLVPIEFEITIELPDKYVRKDEIPAQESGPTTTGFSGDTLLQFPRAPAAAGACGRTAAADGGSDGGPRRACVSPTSVRTSRG